MIEDKKKKLPGVFLLPNLITKLVDEKINK